MTKVILLMLLAVASDSAMAEWVEIFSTSNRPCVTFIASSPFAHAHGHGGSHKESSHGTVSHSC